MQAPAGSAPGPVVLPDGSAAWTDPRLAATITGPGTEPTTADPAAEAAATRGTGQPPSGVGAAASTPWSIPLLLGDRTVLVVGERVWPPAPHPAPWWALTLAAALGVFSLTGSALLTRRRSTERLVAGVVLAVVVAQALHVAGAAAVRAEPPSVGGVLAAAGVGLVGWVLGLVGAGLAVRGSPLWLPACAIAGGLGTLLTVFDTAAFHRAVLAFGGPFDLDRALLVIAAGGGGGLLVAGLVALVRPVGVRP